MFVPSGGDQTFLKTLQQLRVGGIEGRFASPPLEGQWVPRRPGWEAGVPRSSGEGELRATCLVKTETHFILK